MLLLRKVRFLSCCFFGCRQFCFPRWPTQKPTERISRRSVLYLCEYVSKYILLHLIDSGGRWGSNGCCCYLPDLAWFLPIIRNRLGVQYSYADKQHPNHAGWQKQRFRVAKKATYIFNIYQKHLGEQKTFVVQLSPPPLTHDHTRLRSWRVNHPQRGEGEGKETSLAKSRERIEGKFSVPSCYMVRFTQHRAHGGSMWHNVRLVTILVRRRRLWPCKASSATGKEETVWTR